MYSMKKEEPEELSDAWMLRWTNEADIKPLDIKPVKSDTFKSIHDSELEIIKVHETKQDKSENLIAAKNTQKLSYVKHFQLKKLQVKLKRLDHHYYMGYEGEFEKMGGKAKKGTKGRKNYNYEKAKVHEYLTKLCETASVASSTENQVVYKCPDCKTLFSCYGTLKKHIHSSRHFNGNTSFLQLKTFIEILVSHECKICHEKLLCDAYFIARHVRKHSITRLDYIKKFYCKEEDKTMTLINSAPLSNFIGNQCQYTCKVCKKNYNCYQSIGEHFRKTSHNGTLKSLRSFLTKVVLHHCHFCSHKMLCERSIIADHLKGVHKVSLENYLNDTGFKQSRVILGNDLKSLGAHALATPVSKTATNMCQFTCTICSYSNSSWHTFKNHLLRMGHGPIQLQKYINKTVLHQCHLCDKTLLCDKYHIGRHVNRQHHVQLRDYSAQVDAISK